MLTKVFSSLKGTTFVPQKTFPSVILQEGSLFRLTVSFSSLKDIPKESQDFGAIVEIRSDSSRSAQGRLLGLGFVDSERRVVDCFHVTDPLNPLPVIDDKFFLGKFSRSFEQRRRSLATSTSCYRAVHGSHDRFPPLYVDHFSMPFSRIVAPSAGGERLTSLAATFLREKGAEQIIVGAKSVPLQRIVFGTGSLLNNEPRDYYQESGVQFLWLPKGVDVCEEVHGEVGRRSLLNLEFRRSRRLMRDSCKGKRCLCINDSVGGMALNAVMSAKTVHVVEPDETIRNFISENLVFNFGVALFPDVVSTGYRSVDELVDDTSTRGATKKRSFDVISVDSHSSTLRTSDDWRQMLNKLMKITSNDGGLWFLNISEFLWSIAEIPRTRYKCAHGGSTEPTATCTEIAQIASDIGVMCGRPVKIAQFIAPESVDFPTDPLSGEGWMRRSVGTLVMLVE